METPPAKRPWGSLVIAVLISSGATAWFVADMDREALIAALARVKVGWVVAAAAILLWEFVIRALRWGVLLRPLGIEARIGDLFAAQVIGAAGNTLLPFRMGEVAKALVAAQRTGAPMTTVIATWAMEKVYDIFGMACLLVLMGAMMPSLSERQYSSDHAEMLLKLPLYGGGLGVLALVAIGVFIFLATRPSAARSTFESILSIAPPPLRRPFLRLFDGFVAGLGGARRGRTLTQAALLSIWLWVDGALAISCLFRAFEMDLPFWSSCFTGVAVALPVIVPQAPGFVGVFHSAMEATMRLLDQPESSAEGFAILFWAVSFLPVTAVGLLATLREGLSWKSLSGLRLDGGSAEASAEQMS